METVEKEAKGVNGQLMLLGNKIRIARKGMMAFSSHGFKGDKEILIKSISAIQFKSASSWTNGYIQFSFLGGQEAKGGLAQAVSDENTIIFKKSQQPEFEQMKSLIERKMAEPDIAPKSVGNLDELEKLAELKQKGIITEEEFNLKKKQILGI
jgi:hypothetical protein